MQLGTRSNNAAVKDNTNGQQRHLHQVPGRAMGLLFTNDKFRILISVPPSGYRLHESNGESQVKKSKCLHLTI